MKELFYIKIGKFEYTKNFLFRKKEKSIEKRINFLDYKKVTTEMDEKSISEFLLKYDNLEKECLKLITKYNKIEDESKVVPEGIKTRTQANNLLKKIIKKDYRHNFYISKELFFEFVLRGSELELSFINYNFMRTTINIKYIYINEKDLIDLINDIIKIEKSWST